jgi:hypothetical protein
MGLGSGIRGPGSGKNLFRIPDPGVKKAPDPGSRSATLRSIRSMASGFSLLSIPVKGRFLIHAEGSAGDNSSSSKILQVTDDVKEGLAVVAGRRPKILVDGHPSKLSPITQKY